jgi:hypothetical protein
LQKVPALDFFSENSWLASAVLNTPMALDEKSPLLEQLLIAHPALPSAKEGLK